MAAARRDRLGPLHPVTTPGLGGTTTGTITISAPRPGAVCVAIVTRSRPMAISAIGSAISKNVPTIDLTAKSFVRQRNRQPTGVRSRGRLRCAGAARIAHRQTRSTASAPMDVHLWQAHRHSSEPVQDNRYETGRHRSSPNSCLRRSWAAAALRPGARSNLPGCIGIIVPTRNSRQLDRRSC